MNFIRNIFLYLTVTVLTFYSSFGQATIKNNYTTDSLLPRLSIERVLIYSPQSEWLYSHHASIAVFKDKFIAIWSNGMKDEDAAGQKVVFATSADFTHWSAPQILATPGIYKKDTANVLTAAGFHQFKDTLVAYYGEYSPYRTNTSLWAKYSTDGQNWSAPINMNIPVNPNHGPQVIKGGRLIISGNFTFPYTDDYAGLSGWKMSSFYPDSIYTQDNPATFYAPAEKNNLPPLCEGSFFQTSEGEIEMLLRVTGKGWKGKLWLTRSKDRGEHWSYPVETNFTDNDSKFHFGNLPDKRFYYIGIPYTMHHYARTPLVLALSRDGKFFNKQFVIAEQPYTLQKQGLWKGGQYGYPHTIIYKDQMYIIVSRQKEAIEVLRFKLNQLRE